MKTKPNIQILPVFVAALGFLALILRLALFLLGTDEKGLLISGHPLGILVWTVTVFAAAATILGIRKLDGSRKYEHNFAPSAAAAIGAFALAGGITVAVIFGWNTWTKLELIRNVCGLLAVPALVALGLFRYRGKPPVFPLHGLVCLYLILHTISHYQLWSSRPQLQNWFFPMLASLLLTLFAYYLTAFDANMGKRRMQLAAGLLSVFFCIAAMAGGEDVPLYLGGAVWALTNLCRLTPVKRRRKNPITELTQEETQ